MKRSIAMVFICSMFLVSATSASLVLPVNVNDIVERSDVAFSGVCKEAVPHVIFPSEVPQGILATTYTFEVSPEEVLKGSVPETFTFSQWGATYEVAKAMGLQYPIGMPHYEVGKEYVLFLTSESSIGLRSPIGLGNGSFGLVESRDGKVTVMNSFGNKGLFADMPKSEKVTKAMSAGKISKAAKSGGPLEYSAFKKLVRDLEKGE